MIWRATHSAVGFQRAAAVLSVTSTRAEGEAGALLQTLAQRRTHQRARRPGAALALHIAHEAESALGDHLAGRAVARIAVARDYRLDPSAIRQLAQEEDVVEALLALFPSRACAGFETAGPEQETIVAKVSVDTRAISPNPGATIISS